MEKIKNIIAKNEMAKNGYTQNDGIQPIDKVQNVARYKKLKAKPGSTEQGEDQLWQGDELDLQQASDSEAAQYDSLASAETNFIDQIAAESPAEFLTQSGFNKVLLAQAETAVIDYSAAVSSAAAPTAASTATVATASSIGVGPLGLLSVAGLSVAAVAANAKNQQSTDPLPATPDPDTSITAAPTGTHTVTISGDTGTAGDRITSDALVQVNLTLANSLTLASDETLQVSADGGTTWVAATGSGTSWSTADNAVTLAASGNITARILDTAGNTRAITLSSNDYSIDSSVTAAPTGTHTVTISGDSGTAGDRLTSDALVQVNLTLGSSLTLASDETLQVSADGGTTWVAATGSGTSWSTADNAVTLAASGNITARILDTAGNTRAITLSSNDYSIDSSVTAAPTGTHTVTISNDTDIAGDLITRDPHVQVNLSLGNSLTLASDETLQVSADGGTTWVATTGAGTSWSTAGNAVALDASGDFSARIVDTAGNARAITLTGTGYTFDPVLPGAPTLSSVTDNYGLTQTTLNPGDVTDDNTPTLRFDLNGTQAVDGDSIRLFNGSDALGLDQVLTQNDIDQGYVDVTPSALYAGTYNFSAKLIDFADDVSGFSNSQSLTVILTASQRLQGKAGDLNDANWLGAQYGITDQQVVAISDGGYVVVWTSSHSYNSSQSTVYLQRYAADNTAVGAVQIVPGQSLSSNTLVSAMALPGGEYLVTWASDSLTVDGQDILVQRYDANNAPSGAVQRLQGQAGASDWKPEVTMLADHGYVITWTFASTNGQFNDIAFQRFAADGTPAVGGVLAGEAGQDDRNAVVHALSDGGFVIAWTGVNSDGGRDIFVQRYDSASNTVGGIKVLEGESGPLDNAPYLNAVSVTALADGCYVLAWEGQTSIEGMDVFVQQFDADDQAVGSKLQLQGYLDATSPDLKDDFGVKVTALSDGTYVVAWLGGNTDFNDVTYNGIFIQHIGANNVVIGAPQQLNEAAGIDNYDLQMAALPNGGYLVTWYAWSDSNYGYYVNVQRYDVDSVAVGPVQQLEVPTEVKVGNWSGEDSYNPKITVLQDGGYVVSWEGFSTDGHNYDLFLQRFDALGMPVQDVTASTVQSVSLNATVAQNGTLNADTDVSVSVSFDEAVYVSGTPQLTLNIGGTPVQATYASGNGTRALIFTYTIAANQTDTDGVDIYADSLSLNGGKITDVAGNNASFTVDTTLPVLSYTDSGTNTTDGITLDGTVTVSGLQTSTNWQYSTNGGATWTAGSGASFTLTPGNYAAGSIQVRQLDTATNISKMGQLSNSLTVDGFSLTDNVGTVQGDLAATESLFFDTSIAPNANVWTTQVNVSSTGSTWELAAGNGTSLQSDVLGYSGEVKAVNARISIPATGGSYQNMQVWIGSDVITIGCDWSWNPTTYGIFINGSRVYDSSIAADTPTDVRLELQSDGSVKFYLDSSLVHTSGVGLFSSGEEIKVGFSRWVDGVTPLTVSNLGLEYTRGLTDDATPTLSGSLTSALGMGEELAVYATAVDNVLTKLGEATFVGQDWSFTPGAALADGSYKITAVVQPLGDTDLTNALLVMPSKVITVDTVAPLAPVLLSVTDNYGLTQTTLNSGDVTDDNTPMLRYDLTGTNVVAGDSIQLFNGIDALGSAQTITQTDIDNHYVDVTASALYAGSYDLSAQLIDAAGNASTPSNSQDGTVILTATHQLQGEPGSQVDGFFLNDPYGTDTQTLALSDGGYVIAWSATTSDAQGTDVFLQRFTANDLQVGDVQRLQGTAGLFADGRVSLTALSDGQYLIAWQSERAIGSEFDVFLQHYDASNVPGSPEVLTTSLGAVNLAPKITTLSDGGYVVAWQADINDGQGKDVFFKAYSASGTAGTVQQLGAESGNWDDGMPNITALNEGEFVIAWSAQTAAGGQDVFVQRYNSDGSQFGPVQSLEGIAGLIDAEGFFIGSSIPSVAAFADGGYAVVWAAAILNSPTTNSPYSSDVFIQRFDFNNDKVNPTNANVVPPPVRLQAADYTDVWHPKVITLANGGYVVGWTGYNVNDGEEWDVYLRSFNAQGVEVGNHRLTSAAQAGGPGVWDTDLQLTALVGGGYVAAWTGWGFDSAIYTQQYDGGVNDATVGPLQRVSSEEVVIFDSFPAVTAMQDGGYVLTWQGNDSTSGLDLFTKRFDANGLPWVDTPALSLNLSDISMGVGGFVVNGQDSGDASGMSVSSAGDVNGDGLTDFLVGAFLASPNALNFGGRSYVVFGKTGRAAIELSDVQSGVGGFVLNGECANDGNGASVSAAGDINGDGLSDVIVGNYGHWSGGGGGGQSYVVYGKTDTLAVDLAAVATGTGSDGFAINGGACGDFNGVSVSAAGDVNGDGFADLIIGAPLAMSSSGRSYVVFGKSAMGVTPIELSDVGGSVDGFVMDGETNGDSTGESVSAAGDVNGDGLADLIVHSGVGRSYVVFGKTSPGAVALSSLAADNAGFLLEAPSLNNGGGVRTAVSALGDVNGDGLADLIVGQFVPPLSTTGGLGQSYVVFGKADTTTVDLTAVGTGGFVINGLALEDGSGYSVNSAGDFNGDGLADMMVGAPGMSINATDIGKTYVVFGKAGTEAIELSDIAQGRGGFVINGEVAGDVSGNALSAGDFNGDGLSDLLVGAVVAAPGGLAGAGRSYVIFGTTTGIGNTTFVDQMGTASDDTLNSTGAQTLVGNAGNDTFNASGADVLYGGMGNDVFVLGTSTVEALQSIFGAVGNTAQLSRIDGGTGIDTIRLSGSAELDLTAVANQAGSNPDGGSRIDSIERIDMATDATGNSLRLSLADVLDMTGMNQFNSTNGWVGLGVKEQFHQLLVDGGSNDAVQIVGDTDWTLQAGTVTADSVHFYNVWNHNSAAAQLLINTDIVM